MPSQTELLYDLGLRNEVVGITKFCTHPEEWHRTKTRVGGTKNVTIETIKSLKPDLILASKEENEKDQIETLANEYPVWVTDVGNLGDALAMIETVGVLCAKEEQARSLQTRVAAALAALKEPSFPRPLRVCYLIWKDPYLTVGRDTFIHDMLRHCGFENCFAHQTRYPETTLEQLQQLNVDVLLLSSEPYPFSEKHAAFFQSQLPQTKIELVDGELFSWYGSRLLRAPAYFQKLQAHMQSMRF